MKSITLAMFQFVFGIGLCLNNLRNSDILKFTTEKISGDSKEYEKLIKDKCVMKLIQEAIYQFGSTYLFIGDSFPHEELIQSLQTNFLHSYFTEPSYLSNLKFETSYNLLIFRNKFKLEDIIKKFKPFQGTKFLILVKNYEEAIEKFEILWKSRLVNAVSSFIENTTIYYYTYFPYSEAHCGEVGKPYLLAQCDILNGTFFRREKLFPKKVSDLHSCPIDVTFTENVPSSYYTGTKKLTGWEIDLINEILTRLDGVPNYKILHMKKAVYRTTKGYQRLVENSEIGGGLAVSLRSLAKTDFCLYGMSLCTTWIVPKKEGSPNSVDFLAKVFSPVVWLLLLLTYFIMALVIKIFFRAKFGNVLFKLIPFLMGNTTRTKKISRRLGTIWLIFCLVVNAFYQSGFKSALLVPNNQKQLVTTEEIVKSNLKILGVSDIVTDILPILKEKFNLNSRRYRNTKMTYEDWVYRMTVKKDSAYLGFKETTYYHIDGTELVNKLYIPDNCVINYPLTFVLKKNSHLTEVIVKLSNRLNENGFLVYFVEKHLSKVLKQYIPKKFAIILRKLKPQESNESPPPITMNKLYVVFICLASGILLAFITFVFEITTAWDWKKIKKTFVKELISACTYNTN